MNDVRSTPSSIPSTPLSTSFSATALLTLDVLFRLGSETTPATAIRIAERAGCTPDVVRQHLLTLASRGLVDAERCRLTFSGLALAASRAQGATLAPKLSRAA